MNLNHKKIILITAAVILLAAILFLKSSKPDGNLEVVSLVLDERTIQFSHTDENKDETLIIKTDSGIYEGEDSADIYVSITNTTKKREKSVVLFYFPKTPEGESGSQLETLEQRNGNDWELLTLFKSNIKINEELLKNALKKRELIPGEQEIKGGSQIEIPAGQTAYLKLKISFPVGSSGEFWVEAIGQNGGYGLLDPMFVSKGGTKIGKTTTSTDTTPGWYSASGNNWTYRKKITIDKNKVSGTSNLSNFPLLVSRTDLDFKHTSFGGNVASSSAGITGGGGDFVFTSSDGTTKLDHEIEKYASSSGELISWVEVPTLSVSADTILYVYYGGPSTGATNQNVTGVWDANYVNVWHLSESGACAVTFIDSTANKNAVCGSGAAPSFLTTAAIGSGRSFDGLDDFIDASNIAYNSSGPFTIGFWVNPNIAGVQRGILEYGDNDSRPFAIFRQTVTNELSVYVSDVYTSDGTLTFNGWQYVAFAIDSNLDGPLYLNGVATAVTNTLVPMVQNAAFWIGKTQFQGNNFFSGGIDEVRVSNIQRSSAWIKTEYNNQSKPSIFAGFGGQQARTSSTTKIGKTTASTDTTPGWYSASGNNWSYRKKITVDKNKVSGTSNLSNFPLLVSRTDSDFKHTSFGGNVASSSAGITGGGGDFVFTSSDGTTKLDHEIEKYASSSGELISWVEVPTLSVSADTVLYVYYGGPSSGATNQNPTGVWDANYKGVWHMKENPAVSSCSTFEVCDSTSNVQNGDSNGSMTAGDQVGSKIGFGLDFDGSNDYISIGDLSAITPPYTVSLWFNTASISSSENDMLFGNAADFETAPKFKISNKQAPNDNGLQADLGAKFRIAKTSFRGESNIWRYATWVIPGTDATAWPIYLNGIEEAYANIDNTGTQTEFGTNNGIAGGDDYAGFAYWNGKIDEVRISNIARSAAWIKTEYNNQSKPSTFAGWGGQQKLNP